MLSRGTAAEWAAVCSSGAEARVERCDAGEAAHVRWLVLASAQMMGVWHAAGVLADSVLPKQAAPALGRVCAPKVHGARSLHRMCAATAVDALAATWTAADVGNSSARLRTTSGEGKSIGHIRTGQ